MARDKNKRESNTLQRRIDELESQVRELEHRLSAGSDQSARLRELLRVAPGFIFMMDRDGQVLFANDTFARVLGFSAGEMDRLESRGVANDEDFAHGQTQAFFGGGRMLELVMENREVLESGIARHEPEYVVTFDDGSEKTLQLQRERYTDPVTGEAIVVGFGADISRRVQAEARLLRGRDALLLGMLRLTEARDNETGFHLERVCAFSELLAETLRDTYTEIDGRYIHTISVAAALHDVGKIGIADAILKKPDKLTADEYDRMKAHTCIGADALIDTKLKWGDDPLLEMAAEIAVAHHEHWDGGGYPYGIAGEQIPLAARIVAVADVYDALSSTRYYKAAMSHDEACRVIHEGAGSHFDPKVVDAFESLEREFDAIVIAAHLQEQELADGE